jgi:hypothetical protein
LAAACGGGGGARSIPQATPTPVAASTTQAISASGGSVALPAAGGITPTFVFGAGVPAGTTINATASTTAPANAPAPS